jgi:hypothetical protein
MRPERTISGTRDGCCGSGSLFHLARTAQHGQDQGFELLGLDTGFGEEVGRPEGELGAFGRGKVAAGVNH